MKKQKAKCRNLTLFYFLLMLVPLIPYSKVLPEIINAIIFIIVVFFLIFKFKDSFRKQEVYLLIFFLLGLVSVFISRDKIISLLDSFNILILVPIYLIAKNLSTAEKEKSNKAGTKSIVDRMAIALWVVFNKPHCNTGTPLFY